MKRGFAWLLTLLTLLGLLSGCGGGGDTTAPDTASNSAATEEADDAGGSYGAWAEAEVAEDSGGTAEDGASDRLENAKMIYTAAAGQQTQQRQQRQQPRKASFHSNTLLFTPRFQTGASAYSDGKAGRMLQENKKFFQPLFAPGNFSAKGCLFLLKGVQSR